MIFIKSPFGLVGAFPSLASLAGNDKFAQRAKGAIIIVAALRQWGKYHLPLLIKGQHSKPTRKKSRAEFIRFTV